MNKSSITVNRTNFNYVYLFIANKLEISFFFFFCIFQVCPFIKCYRTLQKLLILLCPFNNYCDLKFYNLSLSTILILTFNCKYLFI